MLKLKRHEIPESEGLNMMPMMDVVFQLLIFFILTASVATPTKVEIQLPESTSGVKSKQDQRIVVTYCPKDGKPTITLNADPVPSLESLGQTMKQMASSEAKTPVDIQIDRGVPYNEVVALIDTVRDAGFTRFSLLTLAKSGPGTGGK